MEWGNLACKVFLFFVVFEFAELSASSISQIGQHLHYGFEAYVSTVEEKYWAEVYNKFVIGRSGMYGIFFRHELQFNLTLFK